MVQPSISSEGSNSSLRVSWNASLGGVEHYFLRLNGSFSQDEQMQILTNSSLDYVFEGLSAGQLYSVQVTVCSGPVNASSGFVSNATCKSGYFL